MSTDTKTKTDATKPAETKDAETKTEVRIVPLTVPRLRPVFASMGDSGNLWRATAPSGTPHQHTEDDVFWSNVADKLLVGDIIHVVPDDSAWFREFYVVEADSQARGVPNRRISVASIRPPVDMNATRRVPQADEYKTEMRGDFLKWCVVRIADDKPIVDKCFDKTEADEKMRAFLRTRAPVKKAA